MQRPLRPWLLVVPLAALGILVGHEIAYAITETAREGPHGYLAHLPQIALILALLSLAGASLVERSARMALWPFPAVAVAGFVMQEHLERLEHSGSLPFLLDQPVFLVGVVVQCLVAFVAWLTARFLLRALSVHASHEPLFARWSSTCNSSTPLPVPVLAPQSRRSRAPPQGC